MTSDDGSGPPSVTGTPAAGAAATAEAGVCAEALDGAKPPSTHARAIAHTDRKTTDRFIDIRPRPLTRPEGPTTALMIAHIVVR